MDKAIFQGDYASCYNLFYSDKNYKEEAAYVRALIARHELQKTRTILDLGCGTGVHDRYLPKQGLPLPALTSRLIW
jgi:predicted TPR repeat methyltransferase